MNPLENAHPDIEGFSCNGTLELEETGLYRCPLCGALAESADGVIVGHGDEP